MKSFDDLVDHLKFILRDIIESSTYMKPVKRFVDNRRPLSDEEVIFIETLQFEEQKLMKSNYIYIQDTLTILEFNRDLCIDFSK